MNSGMIRVIDEMVGITHERSRASNWNIIMKLGPVLGFAFILGACTNSARFSSNPFDTSGSYGGPRVISAPVDDFTPISGQGAPLGTVISTPLPPPPGSENVPEPSMHDMLPPPTDLTLGHDPESALVNTPSGQVASLPSSPAPARAAAPSRTSMAGSWRASEAAGGSCRITLSSSPSLDLYKASSSGCASQDLKSVNAWDLRGNEVYLYARGTVVARLRGSGSNFNGVLAKSGAPITLSR